MAKRVTKAISDPANLGSAQSEQAVFVDRVIWAYGRADTCLDMIASLNFDCRVSTAQMSEARAATFRERVLESYQLLLLEARSARAAYRQLDFFLRHFYTPGSPLFKIWTVTAKDAFSAAVDLGIAVLIATAPDESVALHRVMADVPDDQLHDEDRMFMRMIRRAWDTTVEAAWPKIPDLKSGIADLRLQIARERDAVLELGPSKEDGSSEMPRTSTMGASSAVPRRTATPTTTTPRQMLPTYLAATECVMKVKDLATRAPEFRAGLGRSARGATGLRRRSVSSQARARTQKRRTALDGLAAFMADLFGYHDQLSRTPKTTWLAAESLYGPGDGTIDVWTVSAGTAFQVPGLLAGEILVRAGPEIHSFATGDSPTPVDLVKAVRACLERQPAKQLMALLLELQGITPQLNRLSLRLQREWEWVVQGAKGAIPGSPGAPGSVVRALTPDHDRVLAVLGNKPKNCRTVSDIASDGPIRNRETVGRLLAELAGVSPPLVHRPYGTRKGYALTDAGRSHLLPVAPPT